MNTCFTETTEKKKKEPFGHYDISDNYVKGTMPFFSSFEVEEKENEERDKRLNILEEKVISIESKMDKIDNTMSKILIKLEENSKSYKNDVMYNSEK